MTYVCPYCSREHGELVGCCGEVHSVALDDVQQRAYERGMSLERIEEINAMVDKAMAEQLLENEEEA